MKRRNTFVLYPGIMCRRVFLVSCAKIVGNNGFLTYVLDFLAVFPARCAKSAGIILQLR